VDDPEPKHPVWTSLIVAVGSLEIKNATCSSQPIKINVISLQRGRPEASDFSRGG